MRGVTAASRYLARKKMRGADDVLAEDPRSTVLYLRSFQVDNRGGIAGAGGPLDGTLKFLSTPFEDRLADDLSTFGPVVAIGKPGEKLKPLGAARLYCEDDEWQARVEQLLRDSVGIVFVCEVPSDGFAWEIQRIVERDEPTWVLGLIMGDRTGGKEYKRWARAVKGYLPKGLPRASRLPDMEYSDATFPVAWLTFAEDWTPSLTPIINGSDEPAPSSLLATARWTTLAETGRRFTSTRPSAGAAGFEAGQALLRALRDTEVAFERLVDLVDGEIEMSEHYLDGLERLDDAARLEGDKAAGEQVSAARDGFDEARSLASIQLEVVTIEMHLGIAELFLGNTKAARKALRAAFDRSAAMARSLGAHSPKVTFVDGDFDFVDVPAVTAWTTEYLSTRKNRKAATLERSLDAIAPMVNCLADLHNASARRARPLPTLSLEKKWSGFRTDYVALQLTAQLPKPQKTAAKKPAARKPAAKKPHSSFRPVTNPGQQRSGGCMCGRVTYRVLGPLQPVLQCHCENCRRSSGNFVAATRAETASVLIDDADDNLDWYDLGYARYGFCVGCGSTLFYRAEDRDHLTAIMVGTLNDASGLTLKEVWYADEAQPHNTLPAHVPHHAGNR